MEALVSSLLKTGAPWGILCAVLIVMVLQLWRRTNALSDKVFDIGMASMKRDEQTASVLQQFRDEMRELRRGTGAQRPPG